MCYSCELSMKNKWDIWCKAKIQNTFLLLRSYSRSFPVTTSPHKTANVPYFFSFITLT